MPRGGPRRSCSTYVLALRRDAGHGAAILTRQWPGTDAGMKLKKVFLVAIALASTLLPVMWHLWLVTRAGNANFYYNQASALGCRCNEPRRAHVCAACVAWGPQSLVFNLCWGIMLLGFVSTSHLRDKGLKAAAASARAA